MRYEILSSRALFDIRRTLAGTGAKNHSEFSKNIEKLRTIGYTPEDQLYKSLSEDKDPAIPNHFALRTYPPDPHRQSRPPLFARALTAALNPYA